MILLPAYGRDYSSKDAALTDFYANKDFICREWPLTIPDRYINRLQIPVGTMVEFRYKRMVRVFLHTVEDK